MSAKSSIYSSIVVPNTRRVMDGKLTDFLPVEGGKSYRVVLDGRPLLKVPTFIIDGYEPTNWPGIGQFKALGADGPKWHFEQKSCPTEKDPDRTCWEVSLPEGCPELGLPAGYLWLRAK